MSRAGFQWLAREARVPAPAPRGSVRQVQVVLERWARARGTALELGGGCASLSVGWEGDVGAPAFVVAVRPGARVAFPFGRRVLTRRQAFAAAVAAFEALHATGAGVAADVLPLFGPVPLSGSA